MYKQLGCCVVQVGAQTECEDFATGMESQMERTMTKNRSSSSCERTLTRKWSSSTDQIDVCMATVASAEVLSTTGFRQHSAHEVSIPPCVKMPMAADTKVKDFTKELEVNSAVEQSQFTVVSRKDKRTDVTSTTPSISSDRRIVIVIVTVFFFLLFFFAAII